MHLTGYCGPCRLHIGRLAALCSCAVALVLSKPVRADEGGVPFWLSGQFASLAAVPATPGWSLPPMQGHFYNGDAAASKALPRGDSVAARAVIAHATRPVPAELRPRNESARRPARARRRLRLRQEHDRGGYLRVARDTELGRSDSVSGFTDLYPLYAIIGRPRRLLPEDFLPSAWQGCGRAADDTIGPGSRADDHRR